MFKFIDGFKGVGRYQWICILLFATTTGFCIQANVAILFVAPNEVDFFCNDNSGAFANLTWDQQKILMTPFGRCNRPDVNLSSYTVEELINLNVTQLNASRKCDTGFVYDHTYMDYTITEEFNFVCDRKWFVSSAKSIFMVGYFIGALGSGALSDRIGRKKTMIICCIGSCILNFALAAPPNEWFFILARCVVGAFTIGYYTSALVLHTELVRKEQRKVPRTMLSLCLDVIVIFFIAVTLGIRNYRYLQVYVAAGITITSVALCFTIPESPRWLVSQGRNDEARRICKRITKFNSWSDEQIEHLLVSHIEDGETKQYNFWDLLRTPVLRRRTLMISAVWFLHVLAFYAIIFNIGTFYPDVRLGLVISNLIEFPANLLPIILIDTIGRQLSTAVFLGIGGLSCIAMGPVILYEASTRGSLLLLGLAIFSKLMISRQFFISYIYTQELMPTPLRNQGIGLASTASRIGGMIAPQIMLLDDFWPATSSVVLGTATFLACIIVMAVPDTTGMELPQTIDDGEQFKAKHVFGPDYPRRRKTPKTDEVDEESARRLNEAADDKAEPI